MQMAAQYDLGLHQMDVKAAYLHAPMDCEIYIKQPLRIRSKVEHGRYTSL